MGRRGKDTLGDVGKLLDARRFLRQRCAKEKQRHGFKLTGSYCRSGKRTSLSQVQWECNILADHSRMFRTQGFYSDARESSKEKEQVFFSCGGEGKYAARLG